MHRHHEAIKEQRHIEVTVPTQWGSGGCLQGPIESKGDIVERESAKRMQDQRMKTAAGSHSKLEHSSFKMVEPIEDFFSEVPPKR